MKMPKGPRSIRRVPENYSALAKNAFHLHKALQISLVRFLDVLGWRANVCFNFDNIIPVNTLFAKNDIINDNIMHRH